MSLHQLLVQERGVRKRYRSLGWPTRHAGTAFVHDGRLWMVAGSHPDSTPINDVWRLDKTRVP